MGDPLRLRTATLLDAIQTNRDRAIEEADFNRFRQELIRILDAFDPLAATDAFREDVRQAPANAQGMQVLYHVATLVNLAMRRKDAASSAAPRR